MPGTEKGSQWGWEVWFSIQGAFAVFTVTESHYQQSSTQPLWMSSVLYWTWVIRIALAGGMREDMRLGQFWVGNAKSPSVHSNSYEHVPRQPRLPLPGSFSEKQRRQQTWDEAQPNPAQPAPRVGYQCEHWDLAVVCDHHHHSIVRLMHRTRKNCLSRCHKHPQTSDGKTLDTVSEQNGAVRWTCTVKK